MAIALAASLVVTLVACGDDDESQQAPDPTATPDDLPDWIESVYPVPGAQSAADMLIELRFEPGMEPQRTVRLVLDGVDVTAYSELTGDATGPGDLVLTPTVLVYEPTASDEAIAPLDPGDHTATAELVEVTFGEPSDVIDDYTWSFSVL